MKRAGLDGACWPDPVTEDFLRAALLDRSDAEAAWHRVRHHLDRWEYELAEHARLLPMVLYTIGADAAGEDAAPMKRRHREAFRDNTLHLHHAPAWLDPLAGEVPVMLLKGLPLALHAYPDIGRRPMSDVDVLVPTPDMGRAVDLLFEAGWVRAERRPIGHSWRARHSAPLVHPEGGHIDLHHAPGVSFMGGADRKTAVPELWAGQRPSQLVGRPVALPAPEDLLLNVVVHGLTSVPAWSSRWVADAVVLLRTWDVDWARLIDHARRHHVVLPVRSALRYLADGFAVPVPPDVLWDLWSDRVSDGDRRRFAVLTGPEDDRPMTASGVRRARWARLRTALGPGGAAVAAPRFTADLLGVDRLTEAPGAVARRSRRWVDNHVVPSRSPS